ncbi:hypothetical protein RUM43_013773 [Polyplax serrata]|uniref:Notum n=1 Tax=Polyplax serrata TaxID=468196 RepID=A0AAN8S6X0_POLSC
MSSVVRSQANGEMFESPAANQVPDLPNTISAFSKIQLENLDEPNAMTKTYLTDRSVTCNDGSPAGFYLRHSHGSKRWIVFLEGGWYCYDHKSCHARWMEMRSLMSSKLWPPIRTVGGILSTNIEENPFWWNANHVFVPYCTSDSWSGTRARASGGSRFSFMGAAVVRQVILDLLPLGLVNATSLLLTGSSAGGIGVLLNLNAVKSLLHEELRLHRIAVRGVADSGWFLDREPYSRDPQSVTPVDAVRRGIALWQGKVPASCAAYYPNEPWRCYFGYRIYPYLTAPLFVFQWLFDEAQMAADKVGAPVTKHQWDYIHKMGDSLRHTFHNVSAVFAPSCISHSVLTKKDWSMIKIDEISLPNAIRCWELNLQHQHKSIQDLYSFSSDKYVSSPSMLADAPLDNVLKRKSIQLDIYKTVEENNFQSHEERKRRRKKHKNKQRPERVDRERIHKGRRKKRLGRKNKNRPMRSPILGTLNTNASKVMANQAQKCQYHLIERCTWPQCNHSCPKLHNPFTGEEMDFIDLLKSFGMDMASVANALGIDIHTLNNMGHAELLNLLTQQSSAKPLIQISAVDHPKRYLKTNITFKAEPFPGNWSQEKPGNRDYKSNNLCLYWFTVQYDDKPDMLDCFRIQPAWMGQNKMKLKNLSLPTMFLPGTHNSATDVMEAMRRRRGLSHLDNFILTQDQSIWNQLVYGIRFLDLRIGYYPQSSDPKLRFWINHDMLRVRPLLPVLKDVVEFSRASPDEIIILDFHRFPSGFSGTNGPAVHRELLELLKNELKSLTIPRPLSQTKLKLEEIWNSDKRIVVSYSEDNFVWEMPWLWSSVSQRWGNKQSPEALEKFLDKTFRDVVPRKLWAAMAELTPTPLDFLSNGSLRAMADRVNRQLSNWFVENGNWTRRANIVAPDFFLGTNLVNIAIEENINRANEMGQS